MGAQETADAVRNVGLAYEFGYHVACKAPVVVGPGPFGTRLYAEFTGGEVTGERIAGKVLTGGGDWLLVGADGYGRIDVRIQIETHDGAVLYGTYVGLLEMNEAVQQATETAGETDFADQYFRTAARFETGDERYAWVNRCLFLGEGRIHPGVAVAYRFYRVT
jgi:hypothetical protein